jgi:predicted nucleic acid binding AN1-type Zn finger protein
MIEYLLLFSFNYVLGDDSSSLRLHKIYLSFPFFSSIRMNLSSLLFDVWDLTHDHWDLSNTQRGKARVSLAAIIAISSRLKESSHSFDDIDY